MSGSSRGGASKEQEEIARLKKEKEQMAEKLRILELEKEGIKVRTLSMYDGQKIGKSIRSRDSLSIFQSIAEGNMVEENPRMKMYDAQAKEKEMEVDKMKEEMERLKREKEEMFEMLKQLGTDQRMAGTTELTSRNLELDILKERGKEKKAGMDEMKRKNEELEERLTRLELNREARSDAPSSSSGNYVENVENQKIKVFHSVRDIGRRGFEKNENDFNAAGEHIVEYPVLKESQRNTILVLGLSPRKGRCLLILSADRTKWIETNLKYPGESLHGGAVYLDEELYLIGGDANDKALYKLDKTSKWMRLADMNVGRYFIINSCLEWNGYIWVLGGWNDKDKRLSSVERYDPKEDKWTLMPDMKYTRCNAASATWNNGIIISGGFGYSIGVRSTVECFNPKNGSWTKLPHMPTALSHHSLVSYKNTLIVMGGFNRDCLESSLKALDSVWQLDPEETNPKWSPLPSMKYPSNRFAGIVFDEEIYVIGGCGIGYVDLNRVEIFNGQNWRAGPSLPFPMDDTSAMIIPQHFAGRLCNYKP